MTERANERDPRISDGYHFFTNSEPELFREVQEMERNSRWIENIETANLSLSPIDGPIFAMQAVARYGLSAEDTFDTASEGSRLIIHDINEFGSNHYLLREFAIPSVCREAKLEGSALKKWDKETFANVMNMAFKVASGKTLMLERYGRIASLFSSQYEIMPISELLEISKEVLEERFGEIRFKEGTNEHVYTTATWELTGAQNELMAKYEEVLRQAKTTRVFATNFMPAVQFSSSDTSGSSAFLKPVFLMKNGTPFHLGRGVEVNHKKSSHGISRFRKEAMGIYAKFEDNFKQLEKLAQVEVEHPANAIISVCNKLNIGKKHGTYAYELAERYSVGLPSLSAHDVYLCLCEALGNAKRNGATQNTLIDLEEKIAKAAFCDWKDHDVSGTVAWKSTSAKNGG